MITDNIIGYQLSSVSTKRIYAYHPAKMQNGESGFAVATSDEVNLAMEKAIEAWRKYRNIPGKEKARFLQRIADGIENLGELLLITIEEETAYPTARIITERNRTVAQLRMFAELTASESWREITIDEALPNRMPAPRPEMLKMMMPIGPVVVFGASNFPLAYSTMGGDAVSALAVGCPVIIKAHESHLATNALVAEVVMNAARETGMPDGVFSSLNGDGMETGKQLVLHHYTAAVGFTGSFTGGKTLFDLGASRPNPIPVFAEMGSVNPVFILKNVIEQVGEELIPKLISSMTMTVGQFCTNPGILVVENTPGLKSFLDLLKSGLEKIPSAVMLNQSIGRNFRKGIENVKKDAGVTFLLDQHHQDDSVNPVLAMTDAKEFIQNPTLHHEIFGPYTIIVQCNTEPEMDAVAKSIEGQLTASVFYQHEETKRASQLIEILIEKAGRIISNGMPTGVEVCAAMTHGGPFPASTDSRFTAVGHSAIRRWLRPVTFQNSPDEVLPLAIRKS